MLRLVAVSVRGPKYLDGNPSVHPIDRVPPEVGTRFSSIEQAQTYAVRAYATLSSYWRIDIVDDQGQTVMRGFRIGATGRVWTWRPA
jgi:hypothetical protein